MRWVAGIVSVLGVSRGRPDSGPCYSRGVSHSHVYGDSAGFGARLDGHQRNGYTPGCTCTECAACDAECGHHTQEITPAASFL